MSERLDVSIDDVVLDWDQRVEHHKKETARHRQEQANYEIRLTQLRRCIDDPTVAIRAYWSPEGGYEVACIKGCIDESYKGDE